MGIAACRVGFGVFVLLCWLLCSLLAWVVVAFDLCCCDVSLSVCRVRFGVAVVGLWL